MDPWSASTRYRALQHARRLREAFDSVEVLLPRDTLDRHPGRLGQTRFFLTHAARYSRRAQALRELSGRIDVLFVQRGLYALGPALIVRSLDRFAGRLIFDLDDAVFHTSPLLREKGRLARWLYGPQQALALMRRADAIVVSSTWLAEMLPPGLPNVTVLPTVPDPATYIPVVHREEMPVVVGWAGTAGPSYLDPLAHVFRRLAADGVAVLEVVSAAPWSGPSRFRQWRLEEEASLFGRFSIGIMPLPDTAYTRGKAGFKLLQYMAAGLPVISSPVGVNRELVERANAGFLAVTPAEWEEALRTLASDPALRARLGANGRAFVERYADLDAQARTLAEVLIGSPGADGGHR